MDVLTKAQRSHNMSRIRASGTKPELKVRRLLRSLGFVYQPKLYGKPDFFNKKQKIVIFIDGCFWHKCPKHYIAPKQNSKFWKKKISDNVKRDRRITSNLSKEGWNVIRIWEHDIK